MGAASSFDIGVAHGEDAVFLRSFFSHLNPHSKRYNHRKCAAVAGTVLYKSEEWRVKSEDRRDTMIKAWSVSDNNGDGYNYIVYAETRGKAASIAKDCCDGAFDNYTFTELRVLRKPTLDEHYYGKTVLDWFDDKDRMLMVKYAGFKCGDEYDPSEEECASCGGKEYCRRYAIRKMQEDEDESC